MFKMITFILCLSTTALAGEISLNDFLQKAWDQSALAQGEKFKNEEGDELERSAKGKYLPHLSLQAIDTKGFAASSSSLHVGGIMGSPYRSGWAAGVVAEQTVYDFGRISAVLDKVKAENALHEARLANDKVKFLNHLGRIYLSCAKARTLQNQNTRLMNWLEMILKESAQFTKTGQRSVIDNALVKMEMNELIIEQNELKKFQTSLTEEMKLYLSSAGDCQTLSTLWKTPLPVELTVEAPPLLLAKAEKKSAESLLESAKANQLPTLSLVGSLGEMEDVRLVKKEDYSVGVALIFPFWNGGEDLHREKAYRSQLDYNEQLLKQAELEFSNELKGRKDEFDRDQDTLTAIEKDLELGRQTMQLASKRYRQMQGPLVDVRDAFKTLKTIEEKRSKILDFLAFNSLELGMLRQNK